jgi:Transposase DDE domain
MRSRIHRAYKTKYSVANWASYDRALVRRGDVTLWLSPEAIATWEPARVGTRGGPKYSNLAIETALTLRLLFHLPLRQTEGFLTSIFGIMGLDLSVPDHTTLSRRGQSLDLALRRVRTRNRLHLVVDIRDSRSSVKGSGPRRNTEDGASARGLTSFADDGLDPEAY